jgi:hypothetical protein
MKKIQMKNVVLSLGLVLFVAGVCPAQSVLYFPQFVDGVQGNVFWASAIAVTNPAAVGSPAATGTITLTQDNGTSLNLQLFDENHVPIGNTFQLAGGQIKFFNSPVLNGNVGFGQPFSSGFVTITSNLPLSGGLIFYEGGANGAVIGEAGVLSAAPLTRQASVVVKDNNTNVGVAVANPGATANLTFQLVDKSGADLAPPVMRMLPANNHTAFFVSDLFPSVTSKIFGTMRIISDTPVVSTALLFSLGSFATLPLIPVQ